MHGRKIATTVGETGEQAHEPLSNACLVNAYYQHNMLYSERR
ncbi:hypothetical protein [Gallibacterium sp. ZY190522]